MDDSTWTYFIAAPTGHIKVGISAAPNKRLVELRVSNPLPIVLLGAIACPSLWKAKCMEKMLHNMLTANGRHRRGEWFALRVDEMLAIADSFDTEIEPSFLDCLAKYHHQEKLGTLSAFPHPPSKEPNGLGQSFLYFWRKRHSDDLDLELTEM